MHRMNLYRQEKFFFFFSNRQRESSKFIGVEEIVCFFLLNKSKEGWGRGSVSVGTASGHHTSCARQRERERQSIRASCHLSIFPLQVLFILLFFHSPVCTNCFSFNPAAFQNYSLLTANLCCCENSGDGTMSAPETADLSLF